MKEQKELTQKEYQRLSYCFAEAFGSLYRVSNNSENLAGLAQTRLKNGAVERLAEAAAYVGRMSTPNHALIFGLNTILWAFTGASGGAKYTLHIPKRGRVASSMFTLEREPGKGSTIDFYKVAVTFESTELAKEFDKHLLNF